VNIIGNVNVPPSELLRTKNNAHAMVPSTSTFELENEANMWYREEEERKKTAYLLAAQQYTPLVSRNGQIPPKHINAAFLEYGKRRKRMEKDGDKRTLVLLVATGVSTDWVPNEETGQARFLLFPQLAEARGVLFITYMRGPEHGSIDGTFANIFGTWMNQYSAIMYKYFRQGQSSGGYGHYQPDKRLFPFKKYRDRRGRDTDRANKDNPYSRFIWEVEYDNRDPVEIRKRGKKYMQSEYTRLFVAAKFYAHDENGKFEAAILLWEKIAPNNNVVVREAVSFGTKDLSDENRQLFSSAKRRDRLVAVRANQWRRPQPLANPDGPIPDEWKLRVPYQGIIYKVMKEKQADGTRPYLDENSLEEDGRLGDLVINLHLLANQFELSDESSDEGDDDNAESTKGDDDNAE
jgi:hypothetical protein